MGGGVEAHRPALLDQARDLRLRLAQGHPFR
jgi:hypothetical protein